jgi:hypothetical protein
MVNKPGFTLSNGSSWLIGDTLFGAIGDKGIDVSFDWNGPSGPNLRGDDQINFDVYLQRGTQGARLIPCASYPEFQTLYYQMLD